LTRKNASPFFQQWESTFAANIKKTEEKKRRESEIKKNFSLEEYQEFKNKLDQLGKPI
jgi:hypothetical protein